MLVSLDKFRIGVVITADGKSYEVPDPNGRILGGGYLQCIPSICIYAEPRSIVSFCPGGRSLLPEAPRSILGSD